MGGGKPEELIKVLRSVQASGRTLKLAGHHYTATTAYRRLIPPPLVLRTCTTQVMVRCRPLTRTESQLASTSPVHIDQARKELQVSGDVVELLPNVFVVLGALSL